MPDGSVIGMCLILTWMLKICYFLRQTMTVIRKRYVSIFIQDNHYYFSSLCSLFDKTDTIQNKTPHHIHFFFKIKICLSHILSGTHCKIHFDLHRLEYSLNILNVLHREIYLKLHYQK